MKGFVLDICVKGEIIKLRFVLQLNLTFWEYRTRFDSKHFFFFCIIVFEVTHIWHSQKITNTWSSPFHDPQKWTIDLMFKLMKSANTWQYLRTSLPTSLLCRHYKYMFPFWLFEVWSVTCLNANEILNFMKIQSNYQRNQALVSNYSSYFLNNFLVSLCQ